MYTLCLKNTDYPVVSGERALSGALTNLGLQSLLSLPCPVRSIAERGILNNQH